MRCEPKSLCPANDAQPGVPGSQCRPERLRHCSRPAHSRLRGLLIQEAIYLGRHDEIVLVQPLDLLRLQRKGSVAPPEADVGTVALLLGEFADFLHERERLTEVLEPEGALDAAHIIAQLPLWHLGVQGLRLAFRQRRDSALARVQVFSISVSTIGASFCGGLSQERMALESVQPGDIPLSASSFRA